MPTKTWEPPPKQPETDAHPHQAGSAEPRNFATVGRERARNHDASAPPERGSADYEEINTHGSER